MSGTEVVAAPGSGRVVRVSGPLVEVEGLSGVAMAELVALGPQRLPGEIVSIAEGIATVQAYEYTGGLGPGDGADPLGAPLSAVLGPSLLGGAFDGLLRPLREAGRWLTPASSTSVAERTWQFEPCVREGDEVAAGAGLGTVRTDGPVALRILVPAGVQGRVERIADPGHHEEAAVLAVVGGTEVRMAQRWPVRVPRPHRGRLDGGQPLVTGQRVLDLLYPIALGSSAAVPGGFGTGKTVLLQQVAKWCTADVIVYVGCGERGNEMADVVAELGELVDPRTGGRLIQRTVVVANTSNMPMMAREASVYTGMTVAEYFRDMGLHAVLIADSTSRWAEALREFASRSGALPAEEGYPASLGSSLAAFYERAGHVRTLGGELGSVTVIGAVSPPGGDVTEPVTANTERFVRSLWSLDRDLAYARHYPAVSWTSSFSRDAPTVGAWHAAQGDPEWANRRGRVLALVADADRLSALADLVGVGSLPGSERMVLLTGRLVREAVLQQSALSAHDAVSTPEKGAALVDAVLAVHDRCRALVDHGVLASVIEEVDWGPLVRARDETAPGDAAGVDERRAAVLATLDALLPAGRAP
ncbi:MAG: V-type ATP synthase subunit A [Candidatus Nanopelagicales bacterium]|jgi:V/A-type H+-transporting ATPase subunit A|nr:V-type ATP synthase subunit A [Candidatus Nanopelagicales bacterium]